MWGATMANDVDTMIWELCGDCSHVAAGHEPCHLDDDAAERAVGWVALNGPMCPAEGWAGEGRCDACGERCDSILAWAET